MELTEVEYFAAERERDQRAVRSCQEGGSMHTGPFSEEAGHPQRSGYAEVYSVCEGCGKGSPTGSYAFVG
jgi:hypothetical protein